MRESTSSTPTRTPLITSTSTLLLLGASFLNAQATPATGTKQMTDPAKVHASALVIDTHADTPQRFVDEHWNFTDPLNGGMLNYDSAKKGNLDAQFFSIWVDPGQYAANASARRTLELIDGTLEQVRKAPRQTPVLHHRRRHHRRAQIRKVRRPHGHRRRPLHRRLARPPPRLLPPRRPLHDPHLVQHQQLGRLLRRHRRSRHPPPQRPHSLRQTSRRKR